MQHTVAGGGGTDTLGVLPWQPCKQPTLTKNVSVLPRSKSLAELASGSGPLSPRSPYSVMLMSASVPAPLTSLVATLTS